MNLRMIRRLTLAFLATLMVCKTATGAAPRPFEVQIRAGWETPSSHSPVRLLGSVISTRAIETGSAGPYASGPAVVLSGAFRFCSPFAVALDLKYRSTASADPLGYFDLSRQALGFALVGKWFLAPGATVEPWLSLGAGYIRDTQSFRGAAGGGIEARATLVHNGFAIPATFGIDHAFAPWLRIGAYASLEPTVALSGNRMNRINGTPDYESDADALTYVSWVVGVSATVPLGSR